MSVEDWSDRKKNYVILTAVVVMICCQEESQSLCQRYEERCITVDTVCRYFSSGAEFPSDNPQSAAAVSTDDQREAGVAAASGTQSVQ